MSFDYELTTRDFMTALDLARFLTKGSSGGNSFIPGSSPIDGRMEHLVSVGSYDYYHSTGMQFYDIVVIDGNHPSSTSRSFGIRVNTKLGNRTDFNRLELDRAVTKAAEELGVH